MKNVDMLLHRLFLTYLKLDVWSAWLTLKQINNNQHVSNPYRNKGEITIISRIMRCHHLAAVLFTNDATLKQRSVQSNICGKGKQEFKENKRFICKGM